MSFGALVDALDGKETLPPLPVVITFDDGRENKYEFAYPVLRKLGFTATFFPFTHALGRNPRYFTLEQLQELQAAGMTIGSHTCLHVNAHFTDVVQTFHSMPDTRFTPCRTVGSLMSDTA